MSRMTWPERAVRRIVAAQAEGRLDQKFRIPDVRRVFPDCRDWVLKDHYRGNPEGRPVWFIKHARGLYSIHPSRIESP